jgi:hypothetical protein
MHTLITTRNPHCDHIPADGLKVDEFDAEEATELLLTRSRSREVGRSEHERNEATQIVEELGCLPLAIEQAAAYIRETSKDIFRFLPSYRRNRKTHHKNLSRGNRIFYEHSVATTWRLSFDQIEDNVDASHLLKLLAFLNPDCILTDFLSAGTESDMLVTDIDRLYDALES